MSRTSELFSLPVQADPEIMNPAVSVVVPVYNAAPYLPELFACLLAQTFREYEVILVDDGSTDDSPAVLDSFCETHDRFRVIHTRNVGVYNARLFGARQAEGKYIAFIDSDDLYCPEYLEKMVSMAEETDADITVCGFTREDMETGRVYSTEMVRFERRAYDFPEAWDILPMINVALWNKLFRRGLIDHVIPFEKPNRIACDVMFCCSVFPFIHRLAFVPEPLYHYRVRRESASTSIDREEMDLIRKNMLKTRDYVLNIDSSPEMREFLRTAAFIHFGLSLVIRQVQKGEPVDKTVREAEEYLKREFPGYEKAGKTLRWNLSHHMVQGKVLLGRRLFTAHLMRPFLLAYDFVTRKLGKEIKW